MCPSMADKDDAYTPKPKKLSSQVSANHKSRSKYYNQFLYKAIIVAIFIVIVSLLPSQAPDYVNQNLQYSRSWELVQLIFVGIAVSYGLFSKRSDETDKNHHDHQNGSAATKFDNAQSYVAGLLQVPSVFDDENEPASVSDDTNNNNNNKIQTWNSQYQREEPVVLVAEKRTVLEKQRGTTSRFDEKPLLLPVRSLKSRVSEPNEKESTRENSFNNASVTRQSSNSGLKRFSSSSSGKSRNGEFTGLRAVNADETMEANVVLRSPIPWRSRSGRMEMREDDQDGLNSHSLAPYVEDSELKKFESTRSLRSQSSRSLRHESVSSSSQNKSSTPPQTPSSSKNLSPSHSFSSEYQAKSDEDFVRKKSYVKSIPPPAPPPPPPPPFYRKPPLEKSNSTLMNRRISPQKELRRSIRSVPGEFVKTELESLTRRTNSGPELRPKAHNDVSSFGKSVRTIRSAETTVTGNKQQKEFDADVMGEVAKEIEAKSLQKREFTNKLTRKTEPKFRRMTSNELQMAEKEDDYIGKVLVETDESSEVESEDEYFEEIVASSGNVEELPAEKLDNANVIATDEGPDVDKKADEFIAKFREQIRLQRIESIRRSTEQIARKQSSR